MFCTVPESYLQGNSGIQAPRGKSQASKKRRSQILQETGTLPEPSLSPCGRPLDPCGCPCVHHVGMWVWECVCVCAPKSPLNRNSAYRMVQIEVLGRFLEGRRVNLRGRKAYTGARGGKGAKREREGGKEHYLETESSKSASKRLKTGSDVWIRLILGSYWQIEGFSGVSGRVSGIEIH